MRLNTLVVWLALCVAVSWLTACSDDGGGGGDAGLDGGTDADTDADTDMDGDITTSCADATELSLDFEVNNDDMALQTPDDQDFYKFTVEADTWIKLYTDIYHKDIWWPEEPFGFLNPVLQLFTEDGSTLLASADDTYRSPRFSGGDYYDPTFWPNTAAYSLRGPYPSMDSELIYHVANAGTYCIMIQGWESWADQTSTEPTTDWNYDLFGATLATTDEEPNGTPGEANEVELNEDGGGWFGLSYSSYLFGMVDNTTDVDFYTFEQPDDGVSTSIFFARPSGPGGDGVLGNGSTLDLGIVDLLSGDGNVVARLDVALGSKGMSVPVAAGEVVGFMVQGADDWTPGGNDFYAALLVTNATDDEREEEETMLSDGGVDPFGGNDTLETANGVGFQISIGDKNSGFVLGFIDPVGDVDYFEIPVEAGETIDLACSAARSGSGLEGARFAIHDGSDNELQFEVEGDNADIYWGSAEDGASMDPITVEASATYYLRVSASGQDPDVSSNFYRCGIHRIPAE
jgi:hypothetical protein